MYEDVDIADMVIEEQISRVLRQEQHTRIIIIPGCSQDYTEAEIQQIVDGILRRSAIMKISMKAELN